MLAGKPMSDWIAQYETSHRNPVNRLCHTIGIPMIALSLPLFVVGYFAREALWTAIALFVVGWVLQFIGHIAEGKPPEFFKDWRFLFVGLRWWYAKISGRV